MSRLHLSFVGYWKSKWPGWRHCVPSDDTIVELRNCLAVKDSSCGVTFSTMLLWIPGSFLMRPHRFRPALMFSFGMLALYLCALQPAAPAQRDRDPLNDKEIDEMRETAIFPDERIKLMVKFARARITSIDQLRADPKSATDRPQQIHDLLQDFTTLVDEIDGNIDMYATHNADMRKGLKLLIEADSEWLLKLHNLEQQSPPEQLQQYSFVLTNARESVSDSADSARKTLEEQNELAKSNKLNKDYSERRD
jgi:hypothetical protein